MYRIFVLSLIALFLSPFSLIAGERIQNFESIVRINQEGVLMVTERVTYDFGDEEKHGIFRSIPYIYTGTYGTKKISIDDVHVTIDEEDATPFSQNKSEGMVTIKIGDSDKTITGVHTYTISYSVHDAILFLDGRDEVYWNVTGLGWPLPIDRVASKVVLGFSEARVTDAACYVGLYGSQSRCFNTKISDDQRSYEALHIGLGEGEGMTVAVAFPKGLLKEPTLFEKFVAWLMANSIVFVPVAITLFMARQWYTKGRDPKGRSVIVRQYDPPANVSPLAVGVLYDEIAHTHDITALIVHLAVKGHIKIHQYEKKKIVFSSTEYLLEKREPTTGVLSSLEENILKGLFVPEHLSKETILGEELEGVVLSTLSHKLTALYTEVAEDINRELTEQGYFVENPKKVRTTYMASGAVGGFATLWLLVFFGISESPIVYLCVVIAAVSVVGFGYVMPRRTSQGVEAREHILGFREYLDTAEKDRLAFHNDPERTPERFDAFLPYAMVLGVEKAWAKQFADVYRPEPSWYSSGSMSAFNSSLFVTNLSSFTSTMRTASTPQSSGGSGGGGSSGGGFGGGGGGSW